MIATENAQTLAEFRESAAATVERVNRTGEPQAILVDGEVRAVLVSAAVYAEMADEALLSRDVAVIRRSLQQYRAGEGQELHAFSHDLREQVMRLKATEPSGGPE